MACRILVVLSYIGFLYRKKNDFFHFMIVISFVSRWWWIVFIPSISWVSKNRLSSDQSWPSLKKPSGKLATKVMTQTIWDQSVLCWSQPINNQCCGWHKRHDFIRISKMPSVITIRKFWRKKLITSPGNYKAHLRAHSKVIGRKKRKHRLGVLLLLRLKLQA